MTTRREFVASSAAALVGIACGRTVVSSLRAPGSIWDRLGLPAETRAIILHADDVGIAHSVNAAVAEAFERGAIDSCSAMVPCEAFAEFASWARVHKSVDVGIHLTLTSSPNAKSSPVLGIGKVPTLVDADGNFPVSWPATPNVSLSEIDAELRAQVETGKSMGIDITHLDAHQHILQLRSREIFGVLLKIATDNRLPFRSARSWFTRAPWLGEAARKTIPLERLISPGATDATPTAWSSWYAERVRALPSGLSELFMHPGYDRPELQALLPDSRPWGSQWRQRDFDMLFSSELAEALHDVKAMRIGWRRVRDALRLT